MADQSNLPMVVNQDAQRELRGLLAGWLAFSAPAPNPASAKAIEEAERDFVKNVSTIFASGITSETTGSGLEFYKKKLKPLNVQHADNIEMYADASRIVGDAWRKAASLLPPGLVASELESLSKGLESRQRDEKERLDRTDEVLARLKNEAAQYKKLDAAASRAEGAKR